MRSVMRPGCATQCLMCLWREFRGMRTCSHVYNDIVSLLRFNPKHASSTYLKSESQTLYTRNAQRRSKAAQTEETPPEQR